MVDGVIIAGEIWDSEGLGSWPKQGKIVKSWQIQKQDSKQGTQILFDSVRLLIFEKLLEMGNR